MTEPHETIQLRAEISIFVFLESPVWLQADGLANPISPLMMAGNGVRSETLDVHTKVELASNQQAAESTNMSRLHHSDEHNFNSSNFHFVWPIT
jgi:hypothetical protein